VSDLSNPGVSAVGYNKARLCADGLCEGSLNGAIDRRERRAVGQAVRDIHDIGESITTLRQGQIKDARRVGQGIVLQPDRL
jgi:hypothetical protein